MDRFISINNQQNGQRKRKPRKRKTKEPKKIQKRRKIEKDVKKDVSRKVYSVTQDGSDSEIEWDMDEDDLSDGDFRIDLTEYHEKTKDDIEIERLEKKLGIFKKKQKERKELLEEKRKKDELQDFVNEKRIKAKQKKIDSEEDEDVDFDGLDHLWTGLDEDSGNEGDGNEGDMNKHDANEDGNLQALREDQNQSIISKYLPPSLRAKLGEKTSEEFELERKLQSICNKVTIQNMAMILKEAKNLYDTCPHTLFREYLSTIVIRSICDDIQMAGEFLLIFSGFTTGIHNLVGLDFGAHFIEAVCKRFAQETGRQTLLNLSIFFAHLYNMKLISSEFAHEFIQYSLMKKDLCIGLEVIYKFLYSSSIQLARDGILQDIQNSVIVDKEDLSIRASTLLDMIHGDISSSQFQKSEFNKYQEMQKAIYKVQQELKAYGDLTLNISFTDFVNATPYNRWWFTGAKLGNKTDQKEIAPLSKTVSKLHRIAEKNGMNTDLRKSIFVAIVGNSQSADVIEELLKLNVTKNNREMVRILIHCLCKEKKYNPYYANIAKRLAAMKNVGKAFRYVIIEQCKDLFTKTHQIDNFARFFSVLLKEKIISLSLLNGIVDWNNLDGNSLLFYRHLFFTLFVENDLQFEQCGPVFLRIKRIEHLEEFKEDLVKFFNQFREKSIRRTFIESLMKLRDPKATFNRSVDKKIRMLAKKTQQILEWEPEPNAE